MDDLEQELHRSDSSDDESPTREKEPKLPLVKSIFVETSKENGLHKSTKICSEKIREAMLHHRWQEAAEYMACYMQILQDPSKDKVPRIREYVWRIATEILHHHPNSKMEDYNTIYEQMKNFGVRNYLMISLEHSFYLLLNGQIEDAKRQLSVAESWRYGKESAAQYNTAKLIQAYRGLLDYILWCNRKHSDTDNSDASSIQDISSYFRQASVNLKQILKQPGIWDTFILSYVDMLEFYEDHEEALKVLKDYAYDNTFPPNPNAHVYLYQYLKRHDTPEKKLINVLKGLQVLVPSHELMLEYSSLLLLSGQSADLQSALDVILGMLDFRCWSCSLDVWKCLQSIIQKLQCQNDWKETVSLKMASRADWWPALHFTSFHAQKDFEENPELMEVKMLLVTILSPDKMLNYTKVCSREHKRRRRT
ncbi:TATA box-binding protein-associated factor RNA polymerase I subunit A [Thalassophryne amazonica]|uniref:TATA box-binding protein-associated factor RNA polymerase I subunit A n=1 Tax=Thalassophryne amazonica TaxID=390379 RepID=UPI00147269E6|nr:TATA box-binding protein-associated factor RNA polymerase I subunit A [Thalassophryne amazonica]XP_034018453.1 TATA box-binding protein-associated factor RNA polymerase I subunit A [Thalassophryne amazonica]